MVIRRETEFSAQVGLVRETCCCDVVMYFLFSLLAVFWSFVVDIVR